MKKPLTWLSLASLPLVLSGCLSNPSTPDTPRQQPPVQSGPYPYPGPPPVYGGTPDDRAGMPRQGRQGGMQGGGAKIGVLKNNHDRFRQAGGYPPPRPAKNSATLTVSWRIEADTPQLAQTLADHIRFMKGKLEAGANPRAFDRLFLMEAYMKYNHRYDTRIDHRPGSRTVTVIKRARDACAYQVIAAHADAVSQDFFGRGDIRRDYSAIADRILNGPACAADREAIRAYIAARQKDRGQMGRGHGRGHHGGGRGGRWQSHSH